MAARSEPAEVVLELPCVPRLAVVVRTVTAACGTVAGLTFDELTDALLLIDEVYDAFCRVGRSPVLLRVTIEHAVLHLEVSSAPGPRATWPEPQLNLVREVAHRFDTKAALEEESGNLRFRTTVRGTVAEE